MLFFSVILQVVSAIPDCTPFNDMVTAIKYNLPYDYAIFDSGPTPLFSPTGYRTSNKINSQNCGEMFDVIEIIDMLSGSGGVGYCNPANLAGVDFFHLKDYPVGRVDFDLRSILRNIYFNGLEGLSMIESNPGPYSIYHASDGLYLSKDNMATNVSLEFFLRYPINAPYEANAFVEHW